MKFFVTRVAPRSECGGAGTRFDCHPLWKNRAHSDVVAASLLFTTTTTSRPLRAPPRISLSTMDASTDSSIDDLAARTTVKDYGNIRYVMACQP